MKILLIVTLWLLLFFWMPWVAVAVLLAWPIVWLLWQPVRLVLAVIEAVFQLIRAILLLPARLLGAQVA